MSTISEIEAIKKLDEVLCQVEDTAARDRILRWAWGKYASQTAPDAREIADSGTKTKARKRGRKSKKAGRATASPTIVRDLNLRPEGKTSFRVYAEEKAPKSHEERCVIAVYYLKHELGLEAVSVDHVYTCYKDANWRIPANLSNRLSVTAHRQGWLDTSDRTSIAVTTQGENLVQHDLPRETEPDKQQ